MSATRVITGTDERGRPKSEWRSLTDAEPAYGHMEPAFSAPIVRRIATPEELAARDLVAPSPIAPRPASSPRPKPAPPSEEPSVTGSAAPLDATQETLSTLSNAIVVAAEAWAAKVAAAEALATTEGAWRQARAALDIAYRAFGSEDVAPPAVDAVPAPIDPETLVDAHPRPRPKRQAPNGGDVKRAAKAEERAVLVLAALERHGGDTRAAGHELGIRGNIVAIIAKHARARAAAQA